MIKYDIANLIFILPCIAKYTFYLMFDEKTHLNLNISNVDAEHLYYDLSLTFVEEIRILGLSTARLKKKFSSHLKKEYGRGDMYYITFKSIYDVMAFKLTYDIF